MSNPGRKAASVRLESGAEPLPGYRLLLRLGGGGFGEVWKAEGPGGFTVALKFVRLDEGASIEARSLEILKHLRHPNLLTPFGSWQAGAFLVVGMELADGSLWDRLLEATAGGRPGIPRDELLEYMAEVAKGLDYLNSHRHDLGDGRKVGIQHRDLKPQNILLSGGGVKVADFGLSRLLERSVTGHTGCLTPHYAAPEFFGQKTSDHSDQYSLGVTYCVLRGGTLPFRGNPAQLVAAHLYGEPDLTSLPNPERFVVARALAKNPDDRWPNCRDFAEALRAVGTGSIPVPETIDARTEPPPSTVEGETGGTRTVKSKAKPGRAVDRPSSTWPTFPAPPSRPVRRLLAIAFGISLLAIAPKAWWPSDRAKDRLQTEGARPTSPPSLPASGRPTSGAFRFDIPVSWTLACGKIGRLPVRIERHGYDGPITLSFEGSPRSIFFRSTTIPATESQVGAEVSVGVDVDRSGGQVKLVGVGGTIRAESWIQLEVEESDLSYGYQGTKDLASGRYPSAIAHFDQAIRLNPREARYLNDRGRARNAEGEFERAIADFSEALRIDPTSAGILLNRSEACGNLGQIDRAIADLDEAIRLAPGLAAAYANRGKFLGVRDDLDRAIADFNKAILLDANLAVAFAGRGRIHLLKGDLERSNADYERAHRLNPSLVLDLRRSGDAHRDRKEFDRAIADYSEANRLDPKDKRVLDARASLFRDRKDYTRAIADYSEMLRLDSKDARAYRDRGDAYRAANDLDRAVADYSEAIRLDPKDGSSLLNRGDAYRAANDLDRAIADYSEAIRLRPRDVSALRYRGDAFLAKSDHDRAIADFSELIRLNPGGSSAYLERGDAHFGKGDFVRAVDDYTEAVRSFPEDSTAYRNRARALIKLKKYSQATADQKKADQLDRGSR